MTVISVGIGIVFKKIPGFLNQSAPIVEQLSSAMLLFFGIRSIWVRLYAEALLCLLFISKMLISNLFTKTVPRFYFCIIIH